MSTIFGKIVAGEIPCHRVWEDGEHLAFLDIQPWAEGHTLVIPKREEDYLFDLSPERSQALWAAAHHVAQRLKAELDCERVAVLVLGYEVAHAHIHLIPTRSEREVLQAQRHPTDHVALAALASRLRGESPQFDLAGDSASKELPTTEQVESRWDDFAARFVAQAEQTTLRAARAAIDHLALDSARDVLEIGCGGGGAGVELKRCIDATSPSGSSVAHLTLTDISGAMVKIAQARMSETLGERSFEDARVVIERADAQALPYADAQFDRVFSCLNLMLVPDHTAVMRESARVLQPGGRAVWVVWGRPAQSHMMQLTPRALAEVGISAPPPPRSNFHLGGLDTLKDELRSAGFDVVRRWYQPMMTQVESGEAFTEMTLKLRPELIKTLETEERLARFKRTLTRLGDEVIERGEGIGLDALVVVARRAAQ